MARGGCRGARSVSEPDRVVVPDCRGDWRRLLRSGFRRPEAARALKAHVVADQLKRLGGYNWFGAVEPLSDAGPTGWRTRVRLEVGPYCRVGFHRYHSSALVTDLQCGQVPAGMLDGLNSGRAWPPGGQVNVVLDDDGQRHVMLTVRHGRRVATSAVEGEYRAVQRIGGRIWRVPVTAFWQAHRDAAAVYSGLVADWAQAAPGMTAWDLYGGAGVFAAVLGEAVGSRDGYGPLTARVRRRGPPMLRWPICRR
ncbi:hypothetical protein BZL30_0250 [Mycobacterium kansasii]|uniref:Uncharacterized protein n=1 Tax=Mycobacterium kansasii TaxID=1768 RepID=A0A1V3XTX0_MYCKA|nr:hypothetical protein BZL30_0250 [Mycobacterium kansasii]